MDDRERLLGENLVRLRGGRSQQEIAAKMRERGWKWSQSTVWSQESGGRALRLLEARDLANVLGVTVDELTLPEAETSARESLTAAITGLERVRHQLRQLAREVRPALADLQERASELAPTTATDVTAYGQAIDFVTGDVLARVEQAFEHATARDRQAKAAYFAGLASTEDDA